MRRSSKSATYTLQSFCSGVATGTAGLLRAGLAAGDIRVIRGILLRHDGGVEKSKCSKQGV